MDNAYESNLMVTKAKYEPAATTSRSAHGQREGEVEVNTQSGNLFQPTAITSQHMYPQEFSRWSVDIERGPGLQLDTIRHIWPSHFPTPASMVISITQLIKSWLHQALNLGGQCIQIVRPMADFAPEVTPPTTGHNLSNSSTIHPV
jgi:hypothetical protein